MELKELLNSEKLSHLTKYTEDILRETQKKYEIIENLRLKRRNKVINRKFEISSKSYEVLNFIVLSKIFGITTNTDFNYL